jgi:hypothetical protein
MPINNLVMSMSEHFSRTNSTDTDFENNRLAQLAQSYLDNPMLMHQLCDRVYERLYTDLKIQRERIGNSSTGRQ